MIKKTMLILFTSMLFLFTVGCEKDTALPKDSDKAESTTLADTSPNKSDKKVTKSSKDEKTKAEDNSSESSNSANRKATDKTDKSNSANNGSTKTEINTNSNVASSQSADKTNKNLNSGSNGSTTAASTNKSITQSQQKAAAASQRKTTQTTPQQVNQITISIKGVNGVILAPTNVKIEANETVFSATVKQLKKSGIQYDFTGSGATAYMQGINNLYEFDYGPASGWIFKKNGVSPGKSSGSISVKNGDRIEWYYKTE